MIKLYLLTLPILAFFDYLWLGVFAKNFYSVELKDFLLKKFLLAPAAVFYLIYALAILVFAVNPALQSGSLIKALTLGAFLGLIAYATYNLTNMATLSGWPLKVVVIDTLWGVFVTGITSLLIFKIAQLIKV